MRVLHVDSGREMRGGQRQALLLGRALKDTGHATTLLVRKDSPLWRAAEDAGLAVGVANFQTIWREAKNVDVVHAHDARSHTIAAVALALNNAKTPLIVSRRVAFPVQRSAISRWKYAVPARFLAVSQFVARQLKDEGIPSEKIDVVYDAVEESAVAAEWSAEYPVVALATGDPGKGRDLVERAAQLSGIDVLFSDNLGRDLRKASMFIYISRSEGLGSAALLAMQMGVPVIASEVGGLIEVVKHGETGLLVKNEVPEIAQAMERMRSDGAMARLFSERAKARIQAEFTLERMLEQTLASYRRAGAR